MPLIARCPVRTFERRVAFRKKPPGQPGRPRKHYPPANVMGLGPYEAKVMRTVCAVNGHPSTGSGEFAVVRHPDNTYAVWSNDQNYGSLSMTRSEALARADDEARDYDWQSTFWRSKTETSAQIKRLQDLSSDKKREYGQRMRNVYGDMWRRIGPTLCYDEESKVGKLRLGDNGADLRDDIAAWCEEQGIPVKIYYNLPFTVARHGREKTFVYCWVLEFSHPNHAFWFKMRWHGDDIR